MPSAQPTADDEREPGTARRISRWRILGWSAAGVAFLLISGVILVSTFDVKYGTRIYGDRTLVAGRRAAFRVAVYELAKQDFAPLSARLSLVHPGDGRRVPLGEGASGPSRALEVNTRIPEDLAPGKWRLEAEVETPAGRPEIARLSVNVVRTPPAGHPWLRTRNACEAGSRRQNDGTYVRSPLCLKDAPLVRLYPQAGHLVGNLDNGVLAWLADPKAPATWQALSARPAPGLPRPPPPADPSPLVPDAFGLAPFTYVPGYPRGPLRVVSGEKHEDVWLRDWPTQVLLASKRHLLDPEHHLETRIDLLRTHVPLFLDVWAGGRWIGADSTVVAKAPFGYEVKLPDEARGFVAVWAYTEMSGPTGAFDARVYWREPGASSTKGLLALANAAAALPVAHPLADYGAKPPGPDPIFAAVASADPARLDRLGPPGRQSAAEAILSRLEITAPAAPLIGDTVAAKTKALDAWKRSIRRPMLGGLLLLALGVVLGIVYVMVVSQRGVRRRLAELEVDDRVLPESEEEGAGPGRISSTGIVLQALMLLIVLGAAFAALLALLETLRWNWGQ